MTTEPAERPASVRATRKFLGDSTDRIVFPCPPDYIVPGPHAAENTTPRTCVCAWWRTDGETVWMLRTVMRDCPDHGWVDAPAGALGSLLAVAGSAMVPEPMRRPIQRLRASLIRQRAATPVAAPTADVRALVVWLGDVHVPMTVIAAHRELHDLIDWKARPSTLAESWALKGD